MFRFQCVANNMCGLCFNMLSSEIQFPVIAAANLVHLLWHAYDEYNYRPNFVSHVVCSYM